MGRFHLSNQSLFLLSIALSALIGLVVVYRLRRDAEEDDGRTSPEDLLKSFERAYYAGEIDKVKFGRVTASLKAKQMSQPPAPSVPAPPPIDESI